MRKCIVCGTKWENGNVGLFYDYCDECYQTDLETLHKRQREQEENKGPSEPAKESREAR